MKIDKLLKLYKSYIKFRYKQGNFINKLYELIEIIGKEKPDLQLTGIDIEDKLNILFYFIFNTTYHQGQKTQLILNILQLHTPDDDVKNFNKNQIIVNKITEYAVNKHPNLFCDYLYSRLSGRIKPLELFLKSKNII